METLYQGIVLPEVWPPRDVDRQTLAPLPAPPSPPEVINVDLGRQLFVDDFLIADTALETRFHPAEFLPESPVLFPQTRLELNGGLAPLACPFTDGCFFDPRDGLYKLYYHAGWFDGTGLAVSEDAVHWTRKMLDVRPGSNRVIMPPEGGKRDGSCVWLDPESVEARYKMFHFFRLPTGESYGEVRVSRDGLHWGEPTRTGPCGDASSFFYNPFRKKWVYSIRSGCARGRARSYWECDDFVEGAAWGPEDPAFWLRCDEEDCVSCMPNVRYSPKHPPQLYHFNAVAYESVMLGLMGIIKGFDEYDNGVCDERGAPKHIDLHAVFSRDGFRFSRAHRAPFIACTDREGDWNRGYLHACGGLCLVERDRLLFPVGGFSGASPALGGNLYAGASTGLASIRRDGFVSMHANWSRQTLTTRPLRFTEGEGLFVNADALAGYAACEVLDAEGNPIEGFGFDECVPAQRDDTCQQIFFTRRRISELAGRPVRFRFHLVCGDLYSFWIGKDEQGRSGGYVAAGGREYASNRDL